MEQTKLNEYLNAVKNAEAARFVIKQAILYMQNEKKNMDLTEKIQTPKATYWLGEKSILFMKFCALPVCMLLSSTILVIIYQKLTTLLIVADIVMLCIQFSPCFFARIAYRTKLTCSKEKCDAHNKAEHERVEKLKVYENNLDINIASLEKALVVTENCLTSLYKLDIIKNEFRYNLVSISMLCEYVSQGHTLQEGYEMYEADKKQPFFVTDTDTACNTTHLYREIQPTVYMTVCRAISDYNELIAAPLKGSALRHPHVNITVYRKKVTDMAEDTESKINNHFFS